MDDNEPIFEDCSHQGCYVFQPSATSVANGVGNDEADDINNYQDHDDGNDDDIDHHRPRKRQKRRHPAPAETKDKKQKPKQNRKADDVWPRLCAGTEPEELVMLRHATYRQLWHETEERIDAVIDAVDSDALAKIRHFVRSAVPPRRGQLSTALLLSGAQGRRQTQQLLRHWSEGRAEAEAEAAAESPSEAFVQLPAHQCPNLPTALKTLIRLAIDSHPVSRSPDRYAAFLAAHKRLIPMPFDLELLQRYLSQQGLSRVVVALPEIESFDVSLVADLVHHLSLWSDRIPFSLILGISTTIDLFEARLPKATVRLLHAQPFSLSPHADPLYPILRAIHLPRPTSLFLGPSVLGFLAESTHNQSTTPPALKRIIKYAFMSHFFANPLSTLLCDEAFHAILHKPTNQAFLASLLRNTPSFRAHCSDLLRLNTKDAAERVRQLLTSDADTLDHAISSLTASTAHLSSAHTAIDAFVQLYTHPSFNLNSPPTPPSELYVQLSQHLLPGPKTKAFQSTSLYSDLTSDLRKLLAYQFSDIINGLNTLQATSCTASITRIQTLFSDICPPPAAQQPSSPVHLLEICTLALRHPLQATFAPRPRHAIERALSRPSDYLGCDCCADDHHTGISSRNTLSKDKGKAKDKEPTSLLYTLLCEAGKHVNIRDLWDIFSSSLLQVGGGGDRGEDREQEEEEQEDTSSNNNLHHLALFYRALAELKMLGLVQQASSSSLTSVGTSSAAAAASSSRANSSARVDIIARSTWMGL